MIVGNRWPDAAPTLVPEGIMVGFWNGEVDSAPGWAPLSGAEGLEAIEAGWWNGTLCIAAHRPDQPQAPSAVLLAQWSGGNPEVVAVASVADPDLVLTDLQLPDGNGKDLALEIRERCSDMRVVFMSGAYDEALGEDQGVVIVHASPIPCVGSHGEEVRVG